MRLELPGALSLATVLNQRIIMVPGVPLKKPVARQSRWPRWRVAAFKGASAVLMHARPQKKKIKKKYRNRSLDCGTKGCRETEGRDGGEGDGGTRWVLKLSEAR